MILPSAALRNPKMLRTAPLACRTSLVLACFVAATLPAAAGNWPRFRGPNGTGIAAYDFKGELVWQRDLGSFTSQHGPGTSPMVYEDKVILANDQDGKSELLALDGKTGKPVWQKERKAFRACYATPFLLEKGEGTPELIVASTAGV